MTEKQINENGTKAVPITALEWILASIGAFLVVGVIGFLIYRISVNENNPPDLKIKTYEVIEREKSYLVKFIIENTGDKTAADITVEGELKKGDESIETGEVTVDYVPPHSEKKGGLIFTKNPNSFEFEIRAKGYNEP